MLDDSPKSLDPELFAKIRHIQIRTQHLVTEALAGQYESAFKGRGMEFEEVRAYQPGDDIRHIDWKVTSPSRSTKSYRVYKLVYFSKTNDLLNRMGKESIDW